MNEHDIAEQVRRYGSQLPGATLIRPRPRVAKRLVATVTIAAGLVGVAFLMSPKAEAGGLARVEKALTDVKTMVSETYLALGDRPYELRSKSFVRGNTVALVSTRRTMTQRYVLTPDWQVVETGEPLVGIREHQETGMLQTPKTALEYVRDDLRMFVSPKAVQREVHGLSVNGREAYKIEWTDDLDEGGLNRSTVITLWVDAQTSLPIEMVMSQRDANRWPSWVFTRYQFNVPIPDSDLEPRVTPIDIVPRQLAWVEQARDSAPNVGDTTILKVEQNRAGTIFVTWVGGTPPVGIDSTGTAQYRFADDVRPGGVQGDTGTQRRMEVDGKPIMVTVFASVSDMVEEPEVRIRVAQRQMRMPGTSETRILQGAEGRSKPLKVARVDRWPAATDELVLRRFWWQVEPGIYRTQAQFAEEKGDVKRALAAYRRAFELLEGQMGPYAAPYLEPMEKLLRRQGRRLEADKVADQIADMKSKDPNRPWTGPIPPEPARPLRESR